METAKIISLTSEIDNLIYDIKTKIDILQAYVRKIKLHEDITRLKAESDDENLWTDPSKAAKIMQEYSQKTKFADELKSCIDTLQILCELYEDARTDDQAAAEVRDELARLAESVELVYIQTLFSDKYDDFACFVTITAGSGGMEAQDWANMLFNMYLNFAKQSDRYKAEVIEYSDTDVGLKSGVIKVSGAPGTFPHGRLKGEMGVHRLVRPSPFNANNNRHTSFASVIISPVVDDAIVINIVETDLRIDTYRASGAGGQHVNKTDSAVRITHIPTGIVVQCQNDRSQHKNKAEAMRMLRSRLYMLAEEEKKKQNEMTPKGSISWGNQIRSYVLDDSRVKDLRTGLESPQPERVLAGEIDQFLDAYIKWAAGR